MALASRTLFEVLGLGLERQVFGLGCDTYGLGIGLEGSGLDSITANS